jgi:hypothetical protein
MKKTILAAMLLALLPTSLFAWNEPFSTRDKVLESGFVAVTALDWAQSRSVAKHPTRFDEKNPILGTHPSVPAVDAYFAGCVLGHIVVSRLLPTQARPYWQIIWIGVEAGVVQQNYNIGVRIEF